MSIVGFGFTKMNAEKKMAAKGAMNVNNNITITSIEKTKLGLMQGKGAAKISFTFITAYNPDIGAITLEGNTVLMLDEKVIEDLIKTWDKNKVIPKDLAGPVLNYVLEKCNVQSLIMSRDIGLPSPIKLPRVNVEDPVVNIKKKAPAKKTTKKTTKKKK